MIDESQLQQFQATVWEYYSEHARCDLPWRQPGTSGKFDPYKIMVSELMLQQTQVSRVIPKYQEFLERFPSLEVLAAAELGEVLRTWSGLGYNRRAKFLHQAAQTIITRHQGVFPTNHHELVQLPGIGPNTAGAILAYAYNQPVVFIETNIRTVYIHHFFHDQAGISDKAIIEAAMQTLDREQPREWYWALMDYGTHLKQTIGNLNRQSRSYAKQSAFHGSRRQLRGQVLRLLGERPYGLDELTQAVSDERLALVLGDLRAESLIRYSDNEYFL